MSKIGGIEKLAFANSLYDHDKVGDKLRRGIDSTEDAIELHKKMESRLVVELQSVKASRALLEDSLEKQKVSVRDHHNAVGKLIQKTRAGVS